MRPTDNRPPSSTQPRSPPLPAAASGMPPRTQTQAGVQTTTGASRIIEKTHARRPPPALPVKNRARTTGICVFSPDRAGFYETNRSSDGSVYNSGKVARDEDRLAEPDSLGPTGWARSSEPPCGVAAVVGLNGLYRLSQPVLSRARRHELGRPTPTCGRNLTGRTSLPTGEIC